MAMSWRPKTASAFVTLGLARRVVNVLSTYPGATLTKMTLGPNSSLGIQNTSSLLTGSLHLRERTGRDPDKPHVVDSSPRIDQRWSITVWTRHMEKLGTSIAPLGQIREANDDPGTRSSPVARSYAVRSLSTQ